MYPSILPIKLRLRLEVQKNGDPAVNLYDKGNRLMTSGLTNQGDPHLTFYGEAEEQPWR